MKQIHSQQNHKRRSKGESLRHRKPYNVSRHKNISGKKKKNSDNTQSIDNQHTIKSPIKSSVKTLVPRLCVDKNPLLKALLLPIIVGCILNKALVAACFPGHVFYYPNLDYYYDENDVAICKLFRCVCNLEGTDYNCYPYGPC